MGSSGTSNICLFLMLVFVQDITPEKEEDCLEAVWWEKLKAYA